MNDTSSYPELFDGLYEYKSEYKYQNKAIDWHSFDHLKQIAYQNFERILIEVEKVTICYLVKLVKYYFSVRSLCHLIDYFLNSSLEKI